MNSYQLLVLGVLAVLLTLTILAKTRRRITLREGTLWSALWLTAAFTTIWPELTTVVARRLGIGRGADLVFYGAVVAMLLGFWLVHLRLRQIDRQLTLLVRRLALDEAWRSDSSTGPGDRSEA